MDDRLRALRWAKYVAENWENFVVLDVETTGFLEDPDSTIIQIAMATFTKDKDRFRPQLYSWYINPKGQDIPPVITKLTGITNEVVDVAPTFPTLYPMIRDVLLDKTIIAYNIEFDLGMLLKTANQFDIDIEKRFRPSENYQNCAMIQYAAFHGEWHNQSRSYKYKKLDFAAKRLGVDSVFAHNALGDVLTTIGIIGSMATIAEVELP